MSNDRGQARRGWTLALATILIALVPPSVWWVVMQLISDPDEGANIGGGLIGLGILVLSVLGAIGFLGARLAERDSRRH